MITIFPLILVPFLIAMFLAITMGGSGTAPAFSVAFGANLIRKNYIPGLFGLFVFAGAIIAGREVSLTLGKGLMPPENMTLVLTSIVLFSVALSLLVANLLGIPQSTSQSTVFSISGAAVYFDALNQNKLFFEIIPTWFILPVIAFLIMFILCKWVYTPLELKYAGQFQNLKSNVVLKWAVILSSCYVAFSIGANNVANAAGPLASMIINEMGISKDGSSFNLVIILAALVIAPCFGIGSSLFGEKLITKSGKEIIDIDPIAALMISLITATLLLIASVTKGIPTSLVQLNMAALIAFGINKVGWKKIFTDPVVKRFWLVWLIAPLFSFVLSLLLTWGAGKLNILHI